MASEKATQKKMVVGQKIAVTIEKVAHGGHFIARHEGAVIFIRHAIPGEECTIEISSVGSSFNRGDVISVEKSSPDRVTPPCSYAHRLGCGGCDFQHIELGYQRTLKAEVIKDQFARLGGMEIEGEVLGVQPDDGLHWRTRMDFAIGDSGHIGLYSHRSNDVIEIDDCLIADSVMDVPALTSRKWNGNDRIEAGSTSTGQVNISRAGRSISRPTPQRNSPR